MTDSQPWARDPAVRAVYERLVRNILWGGYSEAGATQAVTTVMDAAYAAGRRDERAQQDELSYPTVLTPEPRER